MTAFGIHENYTPSASKLRWPAMTATREFTSGVLTPQDLISKMVNACAPSWNMGFTSYWSFHASKAEVLNGAWRQHLQLLAGYLRDHPTAQTVIIPWHEPEKPGVFTPAEYRQYFSNINGWIKDIYPDQLLCHSALSYQYRPGGTAENGVAWRTDADINAIDIYSGRTWPLNAILPELDVFNRWYDQVVTGGPWTATERGFIAAPGASTQRADTIRREASWMATSAKGKACDLYLAWNTDGSENDPALILDTAGEAAMKDLMNAIVDPEHHATVECPLCHGSGDWTFTYRQSQVID